MILSVFHICLLLGLLFSAFYFFSYSHSSTHAKTHWVVFMVILFTFIFEVVWNFSVAHGVESILLYNSLFVYGKVILILFLFYNLPFSCGLERKVLLAIFLLLFFGLINSFFFQPLSLKIQTYSYLFGNLLVLFFSVFFFKDILRQSKFKHVNLLSLPFFWIATFALFSTGESIIYTAFSSLFFPMQMTKLGFVQLFVHFFSGLMYLVFGLAFYAPIFFRKGYV
ncbi:hypothetical protein [Pleomorphovibrio marinus]|uniref:hypothetical protein n=1 Tax=Pleomorphovibrio marinus TaxID=2164132 RepID=UPI000E0C140B|nr:hypothetical protein [Pleomorphovibrio marinus]